MAKSKNATSDCFTTQKFLLNSFGLLHNENVLRQMLTITLLISLTIYLFSVIPEILNEYYEDFPEFLLFSMFEIGLLLSLICLWCAFWNRFEFTQLFEKLQLLDELSNFKDAKCENIFVKEYKDIIRKQVYFSISWLIILQILLISTPIALSLNEENWLLPFRGGSAIVNDNDLQFIIQIIVLAIMLISCYMLITTYINILTLICGHCKLLQKYIALSFTDYRGEIFKKLDVKLIEKKIPDWESFKVHLRHIVPYHVGIIDAANQVETVFSLIILTFFGLVSMCICLLIYYTQLNIEIQETVNAVLMLMSGYALLITISSYGEDLATESEKIASACYELDFVGCDLRIQKSLILIMTISQRPITPKIGKFKVLGLRTMLSLFQSIYSYYTILRNVINE